ncbi:MAG: Tim44-like domain-containing protein [Burkholderiaceae bacterium]
MKNLIIALTMAVAAAGLVPTEADAKRLGGGGSSGMQRSLPSRAAPDSIPARPTTPAAAPNTAGAPAAAAAKRSWMGPIAGLAAGLGIAALMSHLGMGEGFANIIMLALLAVGGFMLVRFLMARFGPKPAANPNAMAYAGAGAGAGAEPAAPMAIPPTVFPDYRPGATGPGAAAALAPVAAAAITPVETVGRALPAGFDAEGFQRIAKMIFIRMQAANDAADLNDLRNFTTPEMFAAARVDLQDRSNQGQRTDVVKIDAQVLDLEDDGQRQIVSVRFHGLIREEADGVANPFDEVWHMVKPNDGSREWAIAGIQQTA